MKIAFFDTHEFEKEFYQKLNPEIEFTFFETRLTPNTVKLAKDFDGVCLFTNDIANSEVLQALKMFGISLITLRCAGFDKVDLEVAKSLDIQVTRVPSYSPNAIAEYAVSLVMALHRKTHRAYTRVLNHNFMLDGLLGSNIQGKTVGILGTGKIGRIFAEIMSSFGCKILAYDLYENDEFLKIKNTKYTGLEEIYQNSDIISLHLPLTPKTKYILDRSAFSQMKNTVTIINTGRGPLIKTDDLVDALKSKQIGRVGLDVYEGEEDIFFKNLQDEIIEDDKIARLLSFPNVIVTSHQAFLTEEALESMAYTTEKNILGHFLGGDLKESSLT